MLNIANLSKSIKVYGDALYNESTIIGDVNSTEYVLENGNTLKISIGEGKYIYARIRTTVLEAGIDFDTKVFTIQEFVAKRDASGVTENGPWSVSEGDVKLFAY
jgi:hypothetical protein